MSECGIKAHTDSQVGGCCVNPGIVCIDGEDNGRSPTQGVAHVDLLHTACTYPGSGVAQVLGQCIAAARMSFSALWCRVATFDYS